MRNSGRKCRDRDELIAGYTEKEWRAALEVIDDPDRLRLLVLMAARELEADRAAALAKGLKLPRRRQPSKAMRKNPQ